jgi:esterase
MKLNFRKIGQGTPLVILHGVFGSSDNWLTIAKTFAENHTVFLVDLRNHGHSPHSSLFNHQVMTEDLQELFEDQYIFQPILLGHSLGGKVAMKFTTRSQPGTVRKLIVVDIGTKKYSINYAQYLEGMRTMELPNIQTRQQAEEHLLPYVPDAGVRQFLLKNLYRDANNHFAWRLNLSVIEANMPNVGEGLLPSDRSETPAVFVRGELSDYIQEADWAEILTHFPNAILETVPGAGHWVQAGQPVAFLEKVLPYLA